MEFIKYRIKASRLIFRKFLTIFMAACFITITLTSCDSGIAGKTQSATNSGVNDSKYYLLRAKEAFDSPLRTGDSGNTERLADNLSTITEELLAASRADPYRTDILYSVASSYVSRGMIDAAIDTYKKILEITPFDVDALIYLAGWSKYKGNYPDSETYLEAVNKINTEKSTEYRKIFQLIDESLNLSSPASILSNSEETGTIVSLGYRLRDDGTMDPILIERLNKTKEIAKASSDSRIIVTGGSNGISEATEATKMSDWLSANGISGDRIDVEDSATSTVTNAMFSSNILSIQNINNYTLVTSPSHMRRASMIFNVVLQEKGMSEIKQSYITTSTEDKLPEVTDTEKISIYRDAFSASGMFAYRSSPLLVN